MSVFAKHLNTYLKRTGAKWTADVEGARTEFYGVFDAAESVETDNAGKDVVMSNTTVLVKTSVARHFGFKHELTDDQEQVWYCYETLKQDDGLLSKCVLVEKPND